MEEIDIIELFKRIKEGNAPKEIEIKGKKLIYHQDETYFERLYQTENNSWWSNSCFIELNTKIKILDKPIIEEIPLIEIKHDYSNGKTTDTYEVERTITNKELARKINQIIRHINKEEK